MSGRNISILGTRGVPAAHGGFETFAEHLSVYLVEKGWSVTVYCQQEGTGFNWEDDWHAIHRVHIPINQSGSLGSIFFDWKSTLHASNEEGLILTLGYNTALFSTVYRLKGLRNLINMDGIEWRRQKWGKLAKAWFWLNDIAGCWLSNHLIADNPGIEKHLCTRVPSRKITMIPYGSEKVVAADVDLIGQFGLEPYSYSILIARPEPDNSIIEIVTAWSSHPRDCKLVILGNFDIANKYHSAVKKASSNEVVYLGAIYDAATVKALRFFSRFYIHGHTVGGTNPSLVESLGAGNAILAHNNEYNRWVAGDAAVYFDCVKSCSQLISNMLKDEVLIENMRSASNLRHQESFTWQSVLSQYEILLGEYY